MRILVVAGCGLLLLSGSAGRTSDATADRPAAPPPPLPIQTVISVVRYAAPVTPLHVLRAFSPPATPFGPGHLGVDLATSAGQAVHAAADGEVTFAGAVAGRGLVVIAHADGVRTEYEPLRLTVHRGESVRRGAIIGHVDGTHGTCPPGGCLHWGARRGTQYLDPMSLLRPLGPVRLLPWADDQLGS